MTAFGFAGHAMDVNHSRSSSSMLAQAVLPIGFKQLPFNGAIGGAYNYAYSSTQTLLNTSQYLSKSISNLGRGLFSTKASRKRSRSIEDEDDHFDDATKRCRSDPADMMDMDIDYHVGTEEAQQTPKQTWNMQSQLVWWTEPYYD